ncbi:unnamed protein product [Thelazia callipaeda]|uniref:KH domain-containing protein n=1 Tax=Thelazia callipaeda TaxID=103827 RepID=A0A158RBX6_THECL|nr:unnamed protein product [Thelazia callipaeda]
MVLFHILIFSGYQAVPQHHPVTFQQGPSHYPRPSIATCRNYFTHVHALTKLRRNFIAVANNLQQRRAGYEISGGAVIRGSGVHQGSVPSVSIAHQGMQQSGTASGDGPHSIAQGITPLVTSLTPHYSLSPSQDMPLRIVVDAKYVGAIIGQGGASIREIMKESKARCVVDVQRNTEKVFILSFIVISILGQPEGCSKACVKILEIVRKEMEKDNTLPQHCDVELKIRAHNQLVGRLIGRGGATIKKIMEETGAHIFVSNDPTFIRDSYGLMSPYVASSLYGSDVAMYMERTVTVKASTMNVVSAAEQKISQKLRTCFKSDVNSRMLYSSTSATATVPLMASIGEAGYLNNASGLSPHYIRNVVGTANVGSQNRTVHVWVPNNMVGALIGAKGAHIRSAIRLTGAQLRIEGGANKEKKENKEEGNNDKNEENIDATELLKTEVAEVSSNGNEQNKDEENSEPKEDEKKEENVEKAESLKLPKDKDKDPHIEERLVIITGNDPQQYKAQFWIYQRIAEQSYHSMDDIRLCTEIAVPSKLVGRIIGKRGQNVRELQRATGAQVKIPEDAGEDETQKATTVRVIGNFQSSQAVQVKLSQLINDFSQRLNVGPVNGRTDPNTQGMYRSSA